MRNTMNYQLILHYITFKEGGEIDEICKTLLTVILTVLLLSMNLLFTQAMDPADSTYDQNRRSRKTKRIFIEYRLFR